MLTPVDSQYVRVNDTASPANPTPKSSTPTIAGTDRRPSRVSTNGSDVATVNGAKKSPPNLRKL